jgi:transposase-like protein
LPKQARLSPNPSIKGEQLHKAAVLKLFNRILKKHGRPEDTVTDRFRAYSAAMNESAADRHTAGPRLNNRAENLHQPLRRRERAMQQFRSVKALQKFSSIRPRSTTIFIRNVISSPGRLMNRDAGRIGGVAHAYSLERRLREGFAPPQPNRRCLVSTSTRRAG